MDPHLHASPSSRQVKPFWAKCVHAFVLDSNGILQDPEVVAAARAKVLAQTLSSTKKDEGFGMPEIKLNPFS